MEIKINPDYTKMLPELVEKEYQALKGDIKKKGLAKAIQVNPQGVILDGVHRYKACTELGIPPRYEVVDLYGDPILEKRFVFETNINQQQQRRRRQMTKFERIEWVHRAEYLYKDAARKRRLATLKYSGSSVQNYADNQRGRVIDICARLSGVSSSLYVKAIKIIKGGAPDPLLQQLRENKIRISKAYDKLRDESSSSSSKPTAATALTGDRRIQPNFYHIPLVFGYSFEEMQNYLGDESVDLMLTLQLTEGQHPRRYLAILSMAKRILKNGKALFVRVPTEISVGMIDFGTKIGLRHIKTFDLVDNSRPKQNKSSVLLMFTKTYQGTISPNLTKLVGNNISDGSKLANYIIESFSSENDTVFDPLGGNRITEDVSVKLRRCFIGCETT